MTSTLAIVPMRRGSERVRGKNMRDLGGVPLYHHIVDTLLAVPEIDTVVIDTDDDLLIADARESYPTVSIVRRPDELGGGHVSMNDVLANTLSHVSADLVLQVHSTSPFLRSETLSRAFRDLRGSSEHDSAFGVTRFHARFWDHAGKPLNHDPSVLLRTQDLAPIFLENSSLYIFEPAAILERGNRIGASPMLVEVDPIEATDIDVESDFEFAELLWRARNGGEGQ